MPHRQFLSHQGRSQCSISVIDTVWGKQNQTCYNTLGCIQNTHAESVSKYKLPSSSVHAMGLTFWWLLIADFETTCWIVSYRSWISWISWKWHPFSCYHSCHLAILSFGSEILLLCHYVHMHVTAYPWDWDWLLLMNQTDLILPFPCSMSRWRWSILSKCGFLAPDMYSVQNFSHNSWALVVLPGFLWQNFLTSISPKYSLFICIPVFFFAY